MSIDLNAVFSLSAAEKWELFQALGDHIAASAENLSASPQPGEPLGRPAMKVALTAMAHMTPAEKLEVAQVLWEDIPIPQWHLDELDRREAEFERNPEPEMTLEEALAWVINRDGRKT